MLMDARLRQFRKIPQTKENKKIKTPEIKLTNKEDLDLQKEDERKEWIKRFLPVQQKSSWKKDWKRKL